MNATDAFPDADLRRELEQVRAELTQMTAQRDWYRERRYRALEVRDALVQLAEQYLRDAALLVDANESIGDEPVSLGDDMEIQRVDEP